MATVDVSEPGDGALRLVGIDAFRGALLAFMVITSVVGTSGSAPLLQHAEWNGWTPIDFIFPGFLVTSGASLAFLLRPPVSNAVRLRFIRRVISLLVLGVLYNAYGTTGADLSAVRLTGVLQMIGLTGGLAAVLVAAARKLKSLDECLLLGAIGLGLITLYGVGLAALDERCDGRENCSPYVGVDQAVFGESHLYQSKAVDYDPEGLAVVVGATALVLAGYVTGSQLAKRQPLDLRFVGKGSAAGVALISLALVVNQLQPINKRLQTPAFSLLVVGLAVIGLFCFAAIFKYGAQASSGLARRFRAIGAAPLVPLGRNALIVYFAERILLQSASATRVGDGTLQDWLFMHVIPYSGVAADIGYGLLLYAVILSMTATMALMRWRISV